MTTPDKRFTISLEYVGKRKARHVVRFCDEFISDHSSKAKARLAREEAISKRQASLTK